MSHNGSKFGEGHTSAHQTSFEAMLDAMPVAVSWASLATDQILYMNRAFTQSFGYSLEDIPTRRHWDKVYPNPDQRAQITKLWEEQIASLGEVECAVPQVEVDVRCKDGALRTVLIGGVLLPELGYALATFVDITERKQNELRLIDAERIGREQQVLQRMLLEHSHEMTVISPRDPCRRAVSPGVFHITGYTPEEYLAKKPEERAHADDLARGLVAVSKVLERGESVTHRFRLRHKEGGWRWVEGQFRPYRDPENGEVLGYVANVIDIADRKEQEELLSADNERLQQLAGIDELTGLANRRAFNRALADEAARHTRKPGQLALLLVDVDHFKDYNDHYGHLEGDACLQDIATALRSTLGRATDTIARFGGEEFVVLLPFTDAHGAEKVATDLLRALRDLGRPHAASCHHIVTASIGVAYWPATSPLDLHRLLEQADRALYAAKAAGRNTVRVVPHAETRSVKDAT